MDRPGRYTCNDYRQEMILVGLRKQLKRDDLSEKERIDLLEKIHQLELEMDML